MAVKKVAGPKSKMTAELNTTLGEKLLADAAKRLDDRPRLLSQISGFAQKWQQEVFSSQGAVSGKRWKPLAASTAGRPLVRTGELLRELTGAPRQMKASVQVRAPEHADFLKSGRFARSSKVAGGSRSGTVGLGGSMPRRDPAPRPPEKRLAVLTSELLGMVTPRDYRS
ncbi:hypothetical protein [Microbacterium sp. G2-8]|uniref:hypothetical protein n=1 Tax=Microbacterium sp. G2-8 TaxID=2842454 RepID=UPI001C8988FB|nr:hypothetical protein [Microbacterium sp. G2-8]